MTTKGKMSKREIRACLSEAYDDLVMEAKGASFKSTEQVLKEWEPLENWLQTQSAQLTERMAKLETYVDVELQQLNQADRTAQVLQEWEAVKQGTDSWNTMENWLQTQSAQLKRFAEIKKELADEVNNNLKEQGARIYDKSGQLIAIGKFPVVYTIWDDVPSDDSVWGTMWCSEKSKEEDCHDLIMTSGGWEYMEDIFNIDPLFDKAVTYEDIKSALQSFEDSQGKAQHKRNYQNRRNR